MANRPRTISGSLIGVLMIAAFVPFVIWLAVVLSSPIVWVALAVIACTSVALSVRHRRAEAARERAWVDTFSFSEAVRRKRAKDVAVKAEESLQRTARHSFSA